MKNLLKIKISQKPTYIKFAENVDFYELFQKIETDFDTCFIFESLGEEGKFSRYSIIGFDPISIISARKNTLTIDGKNITVKNPYLSLRELMPDQVIARNYAGGLIGYLSYEAVNFFEPSINAKIHPSFDQFLFGVYTDGIILDKITGEIFYFYYDKNRSSFLKKIAQLSKKDFPLQVKFLGDSINKKEHAKIVLQVKEEIKAGNIFQCEVGFKSEFQIKGDALKIYENLRKINPSPFMYYLKFNDKKIIGASPELLFSLREGEMTSKPLAGTIKRGLNEKEDQQLAKILLNDLKERAEHNMLVDLHRNDIGKMARFGTVKIKDYMSVKKFGFVQHISSEIVGLLKNNEDMFSALSANFPAGTLTGAPKIEAMKTINRNEAEARGPYGGAVGHFGFNGDSTFAIAIRSLFISKDYAFTQTSGGIVSDSKPEKEYDEIQRKLAAMRKVLEV
ncbi:anthranilate synthase component I family protein [Candidatus Daviesbacteria bacterium]|nr:anthranilate synthase component I family protein [Candidatus Daviesbacteria bacterium]